MTDVDRADVSAWAEWCGPAPVDDGRTTTAATGLDTNARRPGRGQN